jgi:hypothetical protein
VLSRCFSDVISRYTFLTSVAEPEPYNFATARTGAVILL